MKINFQINVPDWARFLTVDKFGVLECWEKEPCYRPNWMVQDGRWSGGGRRKQLMQYDSQTCRGWKKTLQKIKIL